MAENGLWDELSAWRGRAIRIGIAYLKFEMLRTYEYQMQSYCDTGTMGLALRHATRRFKNEGKYLTYLYRTLS